jgi:MSHA biogenesis protein MshP
MLIRYLHFSENKIANNLLNIAKQQGSSLVLALFVIIILTLLGSVLMRMISTSSETVSQEVLGARAYLAANSAMQAELQLLFPLNTIGVCNATNVAPYDFQTVLGDDIPGLYNCEAFTTCDNYYSDTEDPLAVVQYYRLTSTGKCGSGVMGANSKAIVKSSRTIQVEARSL